MRRAQIAPSDFSSGEADFPQESFVDFKGKRRSMTEKIQASCVRIISGSALSANHSIPHSKGRLPSGKRPFFLEYAREGSALSEKLQQLLYFSLFLPI